MEMAMPASDMMFALIPIACMGRNASSTETGMVTIGMTADGSIAISGSFVRFAVGAVLLGAGTAMVYPTLLAAIGDVAHPRWRASAVGVYRLWRDLGYAIGALIAGITADAFGLASAIWLVAA